MISRQLVLISIVMTGLACAHVNAGVASQMESLRKRIPAARGMAEENGFGLSDAYDKVYLESHLTGVAQRIRVVGKQDLVVLMSYLKDADPKIRFIAAQALELRLHVFPEGMTTTDITDISSPGHTRMVERFAAKLAEPIGAVNERPSGARD